MPRIFDNIALSLLPALSDTLKISERADFCVGYFNLRGWRQIDRLVDAWPGGEGACCRVIVGMQKLPQDELRERFSLISGPDGIDAQATQRLKRAAAQEFRAQLTIGAPTDEDEKGLRRLSAQLKVQKVIVKLFLRHPLHAKLYLAHRTDPNNPSIGFVGSSNLTLAGLCNQGELNVDVVDQDACEKLQRWFESQWNDTWCIDISKELAEIIDTSWAREEPIPPYHIYLKMAYHLSQEAISTTCRDVNPGELSSFPFPRSILEDQVLATLDAKYLKDLERNSTTLVREQKQTGKTESQSFKIQKSKPIIDEIGRALMPHCCITEEELDFVRNFEIKFRMGSDGDEEDAGKVNRN